jgi:6-phosphogluconolactonase
VAQADHVWLLIDGAAKAEAAAHVIAESPAEDWPAAGAHGRKETLVFLADDAARAGA